MFKILARETRKLFTLKRISAFLLLCIFFFEAGCHKKGGTAAPNSGVVENYNLETQIAESWKGFLNDPDWQIIWKKTDTKRLSQLETSVKEGIYAVTLSFGKMWEVEAKIKEGMITSKEQLITELSPVVDSLVSNTKKMRDSFSEYFELMKSSGLAGVIEKYYPILAKDISNEKHPFVQANYQFWGDKFKIDKKTIFDYMNHNMMNQTLKTSYNSLMENMNTILVNQAEKFEGIKPKLTDKVYEKMLQDKEVFFFAKLKPSQNKNKGIEEETEKIEEKLDSAKSEIQDKIAKYSMVAIDVGAGLIFCFPYLGVPLFALGVIILLCDLIIPSIVATWAIGLTAAFTFSHVDTYFLANLPNNPCFIGDCSSDGPSVNGGHDYIGGGYASGYDQPNISGFSFTLGIIYNDTSSLPKEYPLFYTNREITGSLQKNNLSPSGWDFSFLGNSFSLSKASKKWIFTRIKSLYYNGKDFNEDWLQGVYVTAIIDAGIFHANGKDSVLNFVELKRIYHHEAPVISLESYMDSNNQVKTRLAVLNYKNYTEGISGFEICISEEPDKPGISKGIFSLSKFDGNGRINLNEIAALKDCTSYFLVAKVKGNSKYIDSALSNKVTFIPDNNPPSSIDITHVYPAGSNKIKVEWLYSQEPDITGYNVYISENPYITPGNANRVNPRLVMNQNSYEFNIPYGKKWGGQKIYVGVTALDSSGVESQIKSSFPVIVPNLPPETVKQVFTYNVTQNSFSAIWEKTNDKDGAVIGYNVYLRPEGGSFSQINSGLIDKENPFFDFSQLQNNTNYEIYIEALDNGGGKSNSNVFSVRTGVTIPFEVKAIHNSYNSLTFYWNSPNGFSEGGYYKIYVNGVYYTTQLKNQNIIQIGSLDENLRYDIKVEAYDGNNVLAGSCLTQAWTTLKPAQASNFGVSTVSPTQLDLSWNSPSESNVSGYKIYQSESYPIDLSNSFSWEIGNGNTYNVSGLRGNIRYYYAIVPIRNGQEGQPVFAYGVTGNTPPIWSNGSLDALNKADSNIDFSYVELSWNADAYDPDPVDSPLGGGNVKGYKIWISPSDSESIKGRDVEFVFQPKDQTSAKILISNLRGNQTFNFTVKAEDSKSSLSLEKKDIIQKTASNRPYRPAANIGLRKAKYVEITWDQKTSSVWANNPADSDLYGEIDHYEIYYNKQINPIIVDKNTKRYEFTTEKNGIQPGEPLNVKIIAVDNEGVPSSTLSEADELLTYFYLLYEDFNNYQNNTRMSQAQDLSVFPYHEPNASRSQLCSNGLGGKYGLYKDLCDISAEYMPTYLNRDHFYENSVGGWINYFDHYIENGKYKQFVRIGHGSSSYPCGGQHCHTNTPFGCIDWDDSPTTNNNQMDRIILAGVFPANLETVPEKFFLKANYEFFSKLFTYIPERTIPFGFKVAAHTNIVNIGRVAIGLRIDGQFIYEEYLDIRSTTPKTIAKTFSMTGLPLNKDYRGKPFYVYVKYDLRTETCEQFDGSGVGSLDDIFVEIN